MEDDFDCTQILENKPDNDSVFLESKKQVAVLDIAGKEHAVFTGSNLIGRDVKKCDIVVSSRSVSAHHAVIEVDAEDSHLLADLGSSNRTRIGKLILKPHVRYSLTHGIGIQLADLRAVYRILQTEANVADTSSLDIFETPVRHQGSGCTNNLLVHPLRNGQEEDETSFLIPETPLNGKLPGDSICIPPSQDDSSSLHLHYDTDESSSLESSLQLKSPEAFVIQERSSKNTPSLKIASQFSSPEKKKVSCSVNNRGSSKFCSPNGKKSEDVYSAETQVVHGGNNEDGIYLEETQTIIPTKFVAESGSDDEDIYGGATEDALKEIETNALHKSKAPKKKGGTSENKQDTSANMLKHNSRSIYDAETQCLSLVGNENSEEDKDLFQDYIAALPRTAIPNNVSEDVRDSNVQPKSDNPKQDGDSATDDEELCDNKKGPLRNTEDKDTDLYDGKTQLICHVKDSNSKKDTEELISGKAVHLKNSKVHDSSIYDAKTQLISHEKNEDSETDNEESCIEKPELSNKSDLEDSNIYDAITQLISPEKKDGCESDKEELCSDNTGSLNKSEVLNSDIYNAKTQLIFHEKNEDSETDDEELCGEKPQLLNKSEVENTSIYDAKTQLISLEKDHGSQTADEESCSNTHGPSNKSEVANASIYDAKTQLISYEKNEDSETDDEELCNTEPDLSKKSELKDSGIYDAKTQLISHNLKDSETDDEELSSENPGPFNKSEIVDSSIYDAKTQLITLEKNGGSETEDEELCSNVHGPSKPSEAENSSIYDAKTQLISHEKNEDFETDDEELLSNDPDLIKKSELKDSSIYDAKTQLISHDQKDSEIDDEELSSENPGPFNKSEIVDSSIYDEKTQLITLEKNGGSETEDEELCSNVHGPSKKSEAENSSIYDAKTQLISHEKNEDSETDDEELLSNDPDLIKKSELKDCCIYDAKTQLISQERKGSETDNEELCSENPGPLNKSEIVDSSIYDAKTQLITLEKNGGSETEDEELCSNAHGPSNKSEVTNASIYDAKTQRISYEENQDSETDDEELCNNEADLSKKSQLEDSSIYDAKTQLISHKKEDSDIDVKGLSSNETRPLKKSKVEDSSIYDAKTQLISHENIHSETVNEELCINVPGPIKKSEVSSSSIYDPKTQQIFNEKNYSETEDGELCTADKSKVESTGIYNAQTQLISHEKSDSETDDEGLSTGGAELLNKSEVENTSIYDAKTQLISNEKNNSETEDEEICTADKSKVENSDIYNAKTQMICIQKNDVSRTDDKETCTDEPGPSSKTETEDTGIYDAKTQLIFNEKSGDSETEDEELCSDPSRLPSNSNVDTACIYDDKTQLIICKKDGMSTSVKQSPFGNDDSAENKGQLKKNDVQIMNKNACKASSRNQRVSLKPIDMDSLIEDSSNNSDGDGKRDARSPVNIDDESNDSHDIKREIVSSPMHIEDSSNDETESKSNSVTRMSRSLKIFEDSRNATQTSVLTRSSSQSGNKLLVDTAQKSSRITEMIGEAKSSSESHGNTGDVLGGTQNHSAHEPTPSSNDQTNTRRTLSLSRCRRSARHLKDIDSGGSKGNVLRSQSSCVKTVATKESLSECSMPGFEKKNIFPAAPDIAKHSGGVCKTMKLMPVDTGGDATLNIVAEASNEKPKALEENPGISQLASVIKEDCSGKLKALTVEISPATAQRRKLFDVENDQKYIDEEFTLGIRGKKCLRRSVAKKLVNLSSIERVQEERETSTVNAAQDNNHSIGELSPGISNNAARTDGMLESKASQSENGIPLETRSSPRELMAVFEGRAPACGTPVPSTSSGAKQKRLRQSQKVSFKLEDNNCSASTSENKNQRLPDHTDSPDAKQESFNEHISSNPKLADFSSSAPNLTASKRRGRLSQMSAESVPISVSCGNAEAKSKDKRSPACVDANESEEVIALIKEGNSPLYNFISEVKLHNEINDKSKRKKRLSSEKKVSMTPLSKSASVQNYLEKNDEDAATKEDKTHDSGDELNRGTRRSFRKSRNVLEKKLEPPTGTVALEQTHSRERKQSQKDGGKVPLLSCTENKSASSPQYLSSASELKDTKEQRMLPSIGTRISRRNKRDQTESLSIEGDSMTSETASNCSNLSETSEKRVTREVKQTWKVRGAEGLKSVFRRSYSPDISKLPRNAKKTPTKNSKQPDVEETSNSTETPATAVLLTNKSDLAAVNSQKEPQVKSSTRKETKGNVTKVGTLDKLQADSVVEPRKTRSQVSGSSSAREASQSALSQKKVSSSPVKESGSQRVPRKRSREIKPSDAQSLEVGLPSRCSQRLNSTKSAVTRSASSDSQTPERGRRKRRGSSASDAVSETQKTPSKRSMSGPSTHHMEDVEEETDSGDTVLNASPTSASQKRRGSASGSFTADAGQKVKRRRLDSLQPALSSPRSSSRQATTSKTDATTYQVLFTGYSNTQLQAVVGKLGGTLVESADVADVLVTDKVRRTVKFLCIVARGLPVVSPQWLTKSRTAGRLLDPWQYLLVDHEAEVKYDFKLEKSLRSAALNPLLRDYHVFTTESVIPSSQEIKAIVSSCGAKILQRAPTVWPKMSIVISCEEDKLKWNKIKEKNVDIVSAEWLLSGVLQQQLHTKNHKLE